jgi:hypothetical protein
MMQVWQRLFEIIDPNDEGIRPLDLADAAWLVAQWRQFEEVKKSTFLDSSVESVESSPVPEIPLEPEKPNLSWEQPNIYSSDEPSPYHSLFKREDKSLKYLDKDRYYNIQLPADSSSEEEEAFVCPKPPALTHATEIAKALRAFKQTVPSRMRYIIDEGATVESIAETNFWNPVLRQVPERKFDVVLVVEKSISMGFWYDVIMEFKQLLVSQGLFRDVQIWFLIIEEKSIKIQSGLKGRKQALDLRNPAILTNHSGERLILLVSDCVSESWYDGRMAKQIDDWCRHATVALLQMLPESLWERTGLGAAIPLCLTSKVVDGHRPSFKRVKTFFFDEDEVLLDKGACFHIATIEPIPFDRLTKAIAGIGTQSTAGIYLPIQPELEEREESKAFSPLEKLEDFLHVASPNARRLAKLLAAAPRLRLPIIRLVRASLLKGASHVDEIELLLSGLIQVASDSLADEFAFDDIEYTFIPEIREELLDVLPKPDAHEVLESVSKYVEKHLGDGMGFAAAIAEPNSIDSVELGDLSEHFAVVSKSVLKRLGGGFKKVLEQLEAKKIPSDDYKDLGDIPLKIADFIKTRSNQVFFKQPIDHQVYQREHFNILFEKSISSDKTTSVTKREENVSVGIGCNVTKREENVSVGIGCN